MDNDPEQAAIDQAIKVQSILDQLQADRAILDELLKDHQFDTPSFANEVPTDETSTNETPLEETYPQPYPITLSFRPLNIHLIISSEPLLTARLKWSLQILLLIYLLGFFLIYPTTETSFAIFIKDAAQNINIFTAYFVVLLVEMSTVIVTTALVQELEKGYEECEWDGTYVEWVLRELWRGWEGLERWRADEVW